MLPFFVRAQAVPTDSAYLTIAKRKDDTVKIRLLISLGKSWAEVDTRKAMSISEEARVLAQRLHADQMMGRILENLGWINYRRGNYARALALSTEAYALHQKFGNVKGMAGTLNNIAAIYVEQRQFGEAIQNFKKGYQLAEDGDDTVTMSRCVNNIAYSFIKLGQLDSAEFFARKSIEFSKSVSNQSRSSFGTRTLGDVKFEQKKYLEALSLYFDALKRAEQQQNNFLRTSTLHRIGRIYTQLGKYDQALIYLEQNQALAERFDYKNELEQTYKLLAEVYQAKRDFEKVAQYQNLYIAVHDSLYSQRSNEQIALQQAQHDSDIKQTQIDLLQKDALLREGEISQQRAWNYIFMIGLSVMAIIGLILFYTNRKISRINTELKTSNTKIALQANELRILNGTKDKLFSIISHDLRSPLASLKGLLQLMAGDNVTQQEFNKLSINLKRSVDYVSDDLDNMLQWARAQVQGLAPELNVVNLRRIVDNKMMLFAEAAKAKEISLHNNVDAGVEVIVDENHLILIIRNLISNAIKFCRAGGAITASTALVDQRVHISISDTGVGMTKDEIEKLFSIETHFSKPGTQNEKGMGLGLLLVKEFITKNHGSVRVESEFGNGSTFIVSFPGRKKTAD